MSFMRIGDIEGGDVGRAKFGEGESKNTLTIEITAMGDTTIQYLFLDSVDTKALKEYLKEK